MDLPWHAKTDRLLRRHSGFPGQQLIQDVTQSKHFGVAPTWLVAADGEPVLSCTEGGFGPGLKHPKLRKVLMMLQRQNTISRMVLGQSSRKGGLCSDVGVVM